MDRQLDACFQNARPVSTHVALCEMLQRLEANGLALLLAESMTQRRVKGGEESVIFRNSSQKRCLIMAREQNAVPPHIPGWCAPHKSHAKSSDSDTLKSFYFQVVKETVTAFAGKQLYQKLLALHDEDVNAQQANGAAMSTLSTSDRQCILHYGMNAFMEAVAHQESDLRKLAAACRASQHLSSTKIASKVRKFSKLPQEPLPKWAGAHRYNNWFVKIVAPSFDESGNLAVKCNMKGKRNSTLRALHSVFTAPVTSSTSASPRVLVTPIYVETALLKYWKLHDEAAARSRMEALRNHDAEAFAQHISLLKASALLEIMERTEGFMRRIGMRLESQAAGTEILPASLEDKDTETRSLKSSIPAVRKGDSDYARFRAYVASTKSEFKLVHRIDTFVPSQPRELQATLLPHQVDGLRFLASLHANHINGILADEMGVGKTIQTLAFLLYLKETKASLAAVDVRGRSGAETQAPCPHLVLAPLSVIREWREACEQFVSPTFRVGLFQELSDPIRDAPAYDLILMPVHAVRYVGTEAARVQWNYVIVDEAHKVVANLKTFTAQAVLALPCARRLVLTGTPLSSDLQELWSLLHFLNPGVFSDSDAFEEVFRRPFQVYGAKEMELTEEERGLLVLRLHQVLRPFLLRRTKANIDSSLRMTFHRVLCPLSTLQQRVLCILRQRRRTPAVLQVSSRSGEDSEETDGDAAVPPFVEGGLSEVACCGQMHGDNRRGERVVAVDPLTRLITRYLPGLAAANASEALLNRVQADKGVGLTTANVSEFTSQQICNHAFLLPFFSRVLQRHGLDEVTLESTVDADYDDIRNNNGAAAMTLACSGKFLLLHLLLSRLLVAGRKVVLFTHWLSCVDLIMDYLHSRHWHPHTEVLTGGSSEAERKASVRRFQDDPTCLFFVLSIKAGGCGINLQVAHMVVLLDRDYTATNEDQALARVYRIGQRQTVRALCFSTADVSEHRVTQRAAEKNRPRRAIIDDGVYQVREPVEAEAVDGSKSLFIAPEGTGDSTGDDIQIEHLWSLTSSSRNSGNGVTPKEVPSKENEISTNDSGLSTMREFWTALRQLVSSLDDLVLTDEDQKEAADMMMRVGDGGDEAVSAARSSLLEMRTTAVSRLRAVLPPESVEALENELQRCFTVQDNTLSLQSSASLLSTRSAAAFPEQGEVDHDSAAGKDMTGAETTKTIDDGENKHSHILPTADTPKGNKILTHPQRCPALFWLEFAYLFHLAHDGPAVLSAALNTAERNDAKRDDPVEERKRRQRRERRAAKRMRLATVEVPDTFREKCWEDGLEDEMEIAAHYVEHVDARARGHKKQRKATVAGGNTATTE